MSGNLPRELGDLAKLEALFLYANQLTGEIPPELGNLASLKRLRLGGNRLAGCIPVGLRNVSDNDFREIGLPFCETTPTPVIETERAALAALYDAAGGPNWTNDANWLSDRPIGEWHGVTTGDDGRVTVLELADNNLGGEIPSELSSLASLEQLSLRDNQLIGEIPAELGGLVGLQRACASAATG